MASDFWLIAGLGNPGSKYEGTRHNMGFMAADLLAERWSVNFSDHKGLAMLGKGVMNLSGRNVKFFLAKPLTYMNESGNELASISAYYQIEPDHIVVIHDDLLATGGTMMAAYELVKSMNPKKVYINFICELLGLNGRALFPTDVEVTSLFDFPDK